MTDSCDTIDVLIVDWHGGLKGKRMPIALKEKIFSGSVRLPLSSQAMDIWGDDMDSVTQLGLSHGDPDGLCMPAMHSMPLPWNPGHQQVLCSLFVDEQTPSAFDVRQLLKRRIDALLQLGLHPVVAFELEFYLFDASTRYSGRPTVPSQLTIARKPSDLQLYDLRVMDRVESVLQRIRNFAVAMQIPAETALAEFGPGQFEINLKHQSDALLAADQTVLFKQLVDRAAQAEGLLASFMAKPYTEHGGCGQHVHVSLLNDSQQNVLAVDYQSGKTLQAAIASCLNHLEDVQLVLTPHANSYRRLQPDSFAPCRIDWGWDHRGVAIRVPEHQGPNARIEHRVAGADANPYLVLAALLGCLESAWSQTEEPQAPLLPGDKPDGKLLTQNWHTAIRRFEKSEWTASMFGKHFCHIYSAIKRHEANTVFQQVTDVELATYLPRL